MQINSENFSVFLVSIYPAPPLQLLGQNLSIKSSNNDTSCDYMRSTSEVQKVLNELSIVLN